MNTRRLAFFTAAALCALFLSGCISPQLSSTAVPSSSVSMPSMVSHPQMQPIPPSSSVPPVEISWTPITTAPVYTKPESLPAPQFIELPGYVMRDGPGDAFIDHSLLSEPPYSGNRGAIPRPDEMRKDDPDPAVAHTFVADTGFAAAAWGGDPLHIAVSRDNGAVWETVEADTLVPVSAIVSIQFSSPLLGWVMATTEDGGGQILLYKTADGGKTWALASRFPGKVEMPECYFVTADIGWLMGITVEGEAPGMGPLLETADGGGSWHPVLLPDGSALSEWPEIPAYSMIANAWTLDGNDGSYFCAGGENAMWEPTAQVFDIPPPAPGEHSAFADIVGFVCPTEYDWRTGLDPTQTSSFELVCDTFWYITGNHGEHALVPSSNSGDAIISPAQIAEFVRLRYGDEDFDATLLEGYDAEQGGVPHPYGHGGSWMNTCLRCVQRQSNGDIALYYDIVGSVMETFSSLNAVGTYYKLVRPTTAPNGDAFYTLLESRPVIPVPSAYDLYGYN